VRVVGTWTGQHAKALRRAMRFTIEQFSEHLDVSVRTVAYWDAQPDMVPKVDAQQLLDVALDRATADIQARFDVILASEPTQPRPLPDEAAPDRLGTSGDPVTRDVQLATTQTVGLVQRVGDGAVEILTDSLRDLARDHMSATLSEEFAKVSGLRAQAMALAGRTFRPAELADLYVVAGASAALMASIAFDMGRWSEAERLAKLSATYAEVAGHASLDAWVIGLRATLALWDDRPADALALIARGATIAPSAASRYRLHSIGARAAASAGDIEGTTRFLGLAEEELSGLADGSDFIADQIGGEFNFDRARATASAAAAWLALGLPERVEAAAQAAINAYSEMGHLINSSPVNGARIDQAAGRILDGDIDAAAEQLEAVLAQPSPGNLSLVGRMRTTQQHLAEPRWQHDARAAHLSEAVSEWLREVRTQQPAQR